MYSSDGRDADVCLFYVSGEFFAMDARCAHSGMMWRHLIYSFARYFVGMLS